LLLLPLFAPMVSHFGSLLEWCLGVLRLPFFVIERE
jgi:hypothetical protein